MKYLLDVNVLLAWGWADHAEHRRTALWIAAIKRMATPSMQCVRPLGGSCQATPGIDPLTTVKLPPSSGSFLSV